MNTKSPPLLFCFGLALFFALFSTALFSSLRLFAFAPFLAILYHRVSLIKALWIASLCGFLIDLISSDLRLGVHALNYGLTTLLLYAQKRHFFEDKMLALSLFTALISALSTTLQFFLNSIFGKPIPFSLQFLLADLIALPFADAIYAFVWFSCPILLLALLKKVQWRILIGKTLHSIRNFSLKKKHDPSR